MKDIITLLGDFYHSHDLMLKILEDIIKETIRGYRIIDVDIKQFVSILETKPDIIVIGKENRINPQDQNIMHWMTKEIEAKLIECVEKGSKLLAWHSGLASYPIDSAYCKMLRGYFKYHPESNKIVRYYSVKHNVINKSFDFEILDEHYFVHCDVENTNVFLYSVSEDGESIAGWTHRFGNGKILALTPAHREEGLTNNDMRTLIGECIRYLLT